MIFVTSVLINSQLKLNVSLSEVLFNCPYYLINGTTRIAYVTRNGLAKKTRKKYQLYST